MMTDQLELFTDVTVPATHCMVRQVAVVFTAAGGRDRGLQVYHVHPEPDWYCDYLRKRQGQAGMTPDARVMVRTVTCSPWEPA